MEKENEKNTIKLLYYNHMYGTNGRSFIGFLKTHFYHLRGETEKVKKWSDITPTLQLINDVDPDIFVISEVLGETQRKELIKKLSGTYQQFYFGQGHGLGKGSQYVEVLMGTKMRSEEVTIPQLQTPPNWGNGGGMVGVHLPNLDMTILGVHLPLQKRELVFSQQISMLHNLIQLDGKSYILLGDFNVEYEKIKEILPVTTNFTRLSPDEPTYSDTNVVKWFVKDSIDHVLGHNVQLVDSEVISANSDHKAVVVTIIQSEK